MIRAIRYSLVSLLALVSCRGDDAKPEPELKKVDLRIHVQNLGEFCDQMSACTGVPFVLANKRIAEKELALRYEFVERGELLRPHLDWLEEQGLFKFKWSGSYYTVYVVDRKQLFGVSETG